MRNASISFPLAALLAVASLARASELVSPREQSGGNFGLSVARIPDVNADGIADAAVGAFSESGAKGEIEAGRVYLFDGATGALLRELTPPRPRASDLFGYSVAGVDDLDGDGAGEVLVGAFGAEPDGIYEEANVGRAFLFSGATGQLIRILDSPMVQFGGTFGLPVAAVGDVTGDSSPDLAVSGLRENIEGTADAGRVHLYDGKTGAFLRTLVSPDPATASQFGFSIATLPDLNANGSAEIVIGELGQDFTSQGSRTGGVHIFDGATGALIRTLRSPHPEGGGQFGFSVIDTPDATGDDRHDLLVAAWREEAPGSPKDSGRVYLFDGVTFEPRLELASPTPQLDGWFGIDVLGVGDLTGDGRSEIAVGAAYEDGGADLTNSGYLYLFNGATGALIWTMRSPNEDDGGEFGESLAALGDVNGDGWPDLILGAHQESPGNAPDKAGRAYLIDGRRGALTRPRKQILAALLGLDPDPIRLDYNGDAVFDVGDLFQDLLAHP